MPPNEIVDVLIIGGGPAGITAAIQLVRSGLRPLVIEKEQMGGCLYNANWIDNYPPFPRGISGPALADKFEKHILRFGVEMRFDTVSRLYAENESFFAVTNRSLIQPRAVIVASGTKPLPMNIPGEAELADRLIFYELKTLPERPIGRLACIIGGGDAAFDYALSLADRGVKSKILMCSSETRALNILQDKVYLQDSIELLTNYQPVAFVENRDGKHPLTVQLKSAKHRKLSCDFALLAVGREPDIDFIDQDILEHQQNYPLLYFAGDVVNGNFRQVGIAVGDGLRCAMDITRNLSK